MISTLLLLFAMLVPPAVIARWAEVRFAGWPGWRVALTSAMIVPLVLMTPVLLVMISALTSPPERCGVDACGMTLMFGSMALGMLFLLLLASFALNAVIVYRARRKATPEHNNTFE